MKIKIELYGASRDFSNQSFLNFEVDKNSTIKDIRNRLIAVSYTHLTLPTKRIV